MLVMLHLESLHLLLMLRRILLRQMWAALLAAPWGAVKLVVLGQGGTNMAMTIAVAQALPPPLLLLLLSRFFFFSCLFRFCCSQQQQQPSFVVPLHVLDQPDHPAFDVPPHLLCHLTAQQPRHPLLPLLLLLLPNKTATSGTSSSLTKLQCLAQQPRVHNLIVDQLSNPIQLLLLALLLALVH